MTALTSAPLGSVELTAGLFDRRRALNRAYLASLQDDNLLQNHYLQAGLPNGDWQLQPSSPDPRRRGLDRHWGWESPAGQLRGHFLGHWLSAAAREAASTGDAILRARVERVVTELDRCQRANGGEWVFGIPPSYLDMLVDGREIWAPQYNLHKTLMGLVDVARDLDIPLARDVAHRAGRWFARWSEQFSREQFDDILDVETGGMLEVWADLLDLTGDDIFARLLRRYDRQRLFEPLLAGEDVLTNMHANTTIPEVLGAARAYEVTGDRRWADIVHAYWRWAVTERGTYCTGGQTSGEIWTPPGEFAARRGDKNQEHCVVYNMIRLADVLFRWTGDAGYLDYIERNLYNGILAQQDGRTGMISYFLPLEAGARKIWGSPTEDFWCCHGTLVQAHSRHSSLIFYRDPDGAIVIGQYISSRLRTERDGSPVTVEVQRDQHARRVGPDANAARAGDRHRPRHWQVGITITSAPGVSVPIRLRQPDWVSGPATLLAGPDTIDATVTDGFLRFDHPGGNISYRLTLPTAISTEPIPDEPSTVAFLDGPVVLAGLVDHEPTLVGDPRTPEQVLVPDNERQWGEWLSGYRTVGQSRNLRLLPLYEVTDQPYTVYFPMAPAPDQDQQPS